MSVSTLCYSATPPADWPERCAAGGSLFHSTDWQDVLQRGFRCQPLYLWDEGGGSAFALSVFRAGPFRLGYLGFPVGGTIAGPLTAAVVSAVRDLRLPVDLLRIPVSGFSEPVGELALPKVSSPETVVSDLASWRADALPKLTRDLKKARHTAYDIRSPDAVSGAEQIYRLYHDTVRARGGDLRYTPAYFQALLELVGRDARLSCIAAYQQQAMAGFVVVALDAGTGYYLHGATAVFARTTGISDLLVHAALEWAQKQGMASFSLMASPSAQPGLIRYKEKFGGTTRLQHTYELPVNGISTRVFKAAVWARRMAMSWRIRS